MNLLHVDSSILGPNSVSRTISAAIVAHLASSIDNLEVQTRDLATAPLSHLSAADLAGPTSKTAQDAADPADVTEGAAALAEFLAANIVVIGCPMYNFAVPSQLKAWIDRLCVAGKTFRYTASGPEGLVGDKRIIVASSRGGLYGPGTPFAAAEHQETYLRTVFGFLGVTDMTFVRAEGIALGPDQRQNSIASALQDAAALKAA